MTVGAEIIDTQIAERKPVTARLMRALRNNVLGSTTLRANAWVSQSDTTNSTSYVSLWTVEVYVPDIVVGASGTKLTLTDVFVHTLPTAVIPRGTLFKIVIGGSESAVYTHRGTASELVDAEITWTPTGNTTVTVDLQAKVETASNDGQVGWGSINKPLILEAVT